MIDQGNVVALIGKEIVPELTIRAENAKTSIDIFLYSASLPNSRTPLLMSAMFETLRKAPERGLFCRVNFAGWPTTSPQHTESNRVAERLYRSGWKVRFAPIAPILHPKAWFFDGKIAIVGSHNSTVAGLMMNRNISIMTTNEDALNKMLAYFALEWEKAQPYG